MGSFWNLRVWHLLQLRDYILYFCSYAGKEIEGEHETQEIAGESEGTTRKGILSFWKEFVAELKSMISVLICFNKMHIWV